MNLILRPDPLNVLRQERRRLDLPDGSFAGSVLTSHPVPAGLQPFLLVNGEFALHDRRLAEGDFVIVSCVPEGDVAGNLLKSLAVAGSFATGGLFGGKAVLGALAPDTPKPVRLGEEDDSPTYGFGGITSNPFREGSALPVTLGKHPVPGVIINQYTEVQPTPATSFLFTLICVAEHQVYAIGDKKADGGPFTSEAGDLPEGLQIEGQPATDFEGIECYVRMGTPEQAAIPGFAEPRQVFSIEQELLESGDPANAEITPGVYPDGDPALDAWDTPESFTPIGEDADRFTVQLNFPQGLFVRNNDGSLSDKSITFQVRYHETDSGGLLLPSQDWVVLQSQTVIEKRRKAFPFAFSQDFIDSTTFGPGTTTNYLDLVSDGWANAPAPAVVDLTAATEAFTVVCWVNITFDVSATLTAEPSTTVMHIVGQIDTAGTSNEGVNSGWRLQIQRIGQSHSILNGVAVPLMEMRLFTNDGTSTFGWRHFSSSFAKTLGANLQAIPSTTQHGGWVQVAFTYRANAFPDGSGEVHAYFNTTSGSMDNGATPAGVTNASDRPPMIRSQGLRQLVVGALDNGGSARAGDIYIDELRLYQRELSFSEIVQRYNGGAPAPGTASELGIVTGYHFDAGSPTPNYVDAPAPLVFQASAAVGTTDPSPINTGLTGTAKKGFYKVEVQLLSFKDPDGFDGEQVDWTALELRTFETFTYPGCALLAVKIKATDQLNSTAPLIRPMVRGALAPIWDGVDPDNPSLVPTWTQNPAWLMAFIALNREVGLGAFNVQPDWPAFLAYANRCDELLPDGNGSAPILLTAQFDSTVLADPEVPNGYVLVTLDGNDYQPRWPAFRDENSQDGLGYHPDIFLRMTVDPGEPAWLVALDGVDMEVFRIVGNDFDAIAFFCHAPTDQTNGAVATPDATFELTERRFQFDGVFDRTDFSAWQGCVNMCRTAWATPELVGNTLTVQFDSENSSIGLLGEGSIKPGTFRTTFSGLSDRPNHEVVEFLDRDLNYEKTQAEQEHPDLNDPTKSEAFRTRRMRMEGVVRRSQILRHAKKDLNAFNLARRTAQWVTGAEGLIYGRGDVIDVSTDVVQWGFSGRIYQDSSVSTVVYLDREITVDGVTDYDIEIQSGDGTLETQRVNMAAGTYNPGDPITMLTGFTILVRRDDQYAFGETTKVAKQLRIVGADLDTDRFERTVTAIEHDDQIYSVDFGTLPSTPISALPPPQVDGGVGMAASVQMSAQDDTLVAPDGSVDPGIAVEWDSLAKTAEQENKVLEYRLWLGDASGNGMTRVANISGNEHRHRIPGRLLQQNTTYTVAVQPVSRQGQVIPVASCPSELVYVEMVTMPLRPVQNLTARISGEQMFLTWTGAQDAKAVEFRIGGWLLGTFLGSAPGGPGKLTVAHWASGAANAEGVSSPAIYARPVNGLGQYGKLAVLEFDAEVVGANDRIVDQFEEPTWTATKQDLQVEAAPADPTGLHPRDRGAKLKWTGAATTGHYEVEPPALIEAQDVFAQVVVEADQVHPLTWDEATFSWDSLEGNRWTWEGPAWPKAGESQVTLETELDVTTGTALVGDRRRFIPSVYNLRKTAVRVAVTRPDTTYDAKIKRLAVRYTKRPQVPMDFIAIEVFK